MRPGLYLALLLALTTASGGAWADKWLSFDKASGQGVYVWNNGERYEGARANGKPHGQGVKKWPDGRRYGGEFVAGQQQGHGVLSWPDGRRFDGDFANNLMREGRMQYPNGHVYEGSFGSNGSFEGHGVYTWPSAQRYEGEWAGGRYHGQGSLKSADGSLFEGRYANGAETQGVRTTVKGERIETDMEFATAKKSGLGVTVDGNGRRYEGEFVAGQQQGRATLTWPDGRQFVGEFANNLMREGRMQYPNGQFYEGSFGSSGNFEGHGVYTWPSGQRYEGEWAGGRYHGQGSLKSADGSLFEGRYANGAETQGVRTTVKGERIETDMEFATAKKTGLGVTVDGNGRRYEGEFVAGQQQGRGTLTWPDGRRFEGEFANNQMLAGRMRYASGQVYEGGFDSSGRRSGNGVYSWPSGHRYQGEFLNGLQHGYGVMTYADGDRYAGQWANDKRVGKTDREVAQAQRQQSASVQAQEESGPGLFKSLVAIGTGAYVGNAAKSLGSAQQSMLMESAMKSVLNNNADEFKAASNQAMAQSEQEHNARMQAIREKKDRDERAAAEQRAQDSERIRKQNLARQQQAQESQQKLALQQQAQENQQRLALQQQAQEHQQQEQARKKAEAEAAKLAEKRVEKQAAEQYLKSVAAGTRLVATKCPDGEGKYYATGKRPNIKPEVVGCVDLRFRAYCPGSVQYSEGVARNFIGMSGCFGDTYDITPKPNCEVGQVRIEVIEAMPGCNG